MFHLQCIILSETCCGKNAGAAKISHIFQTMSVFQCFVTLYRVALAAHQAVVIKAGVCCVQFQHSSLHYFDGSINL
jgi:hypothetical protein